MVQPVQGAWPRSSLQLWLVTSTDVCALTMPLLAQNKKKVPSEEPLFALNSADLVEADEKVWHVGRFLPSIRYAWQLCSALSFKAACSSRRDSVSLSGSTNRGLTGRLAQSSHAYMPLSRCDSWS